MRTNTLKQKLRAGETAFGVFTRYPAPELAEFLALQGWDFLVFDGEHGILEPRDCMELVRAAEVRDVTPIVRCPTNQPHVILRFMDTGAHGIHVPWVNSGAEAESVVRSAKYHPRGMRGLAGTRGSDYGQNATPAEYTAHLNAETLIVVHIETAESVDRIDEYLAIDGLDVLFIGPSDLSQSYGVPGQSQHPDVQAAMQRVVDAARGTDKIIGTMVTDANGARAWQERGAQYITITTENMLRSASRGFLDAAR